MTVFTASMVYVDGSFRPNQYVSVHDGRIGSITETPPGREGVTDFGDAAVFPGAVNTHTHSHLASLRGSVDELAFDDWLARRVRGGCRNSTSTMSTRARC